MLELRMIKMKKYQTTSNSNTPNPIRIKKLMNLQEKIAISINKQQLQPV